MDVGVRVEDLDKAVLDILKDWSDNTVHRAVNEAVKETAAETAKLLRKGGPYHDRKGAKYTKDWAHKQRTRSYNPITMTETWVVYNKKNYRLTHLLEYGHQVKDKVGLVMGEAKAYPHIAPAYEFARDYLISAISRKIEEGK